MESTIVLAYTYDNIHEISNLLSLKFSKVTLDQIFKREAFEFRRVLKFLIIVSSSIVSSLRLEVCTSTKLSAMISGLGSCHLDSCHLCTHWNGCWVLATVRAQYGVFENWITLLFTWCCVNTCVITALPLYGAFMSDSVYALRYKNAHQLTAWKKDIEIPCCRMRKFVHGFFCIRFRYSFCLDFKTFCPLDPSCSKNIRWTTLLCWRLMNK